MKKEIIEITVKMNLYPPTNSDTIFMDSREVSPIQAGVAIGAGSYVLYLGIKWLVAFVAAGPTGGLGLGLAAATP